MLILSLTMWYILIFSILISSFKKMLVKFIHDLLLSCNLQFEKHCPQSDGMCLLCHCSWFMLSAGSRIRERHWHLTYNHIWQMKTLESLCHVGIQLRQAFNWSIMRSLVWNSVDVRVPQYGWICVTSCQVNVYWQKSILLFCPRNLYWHCFQWIFG